MAAAFQKPATPAPTAILDLRFQHPRWPDLGFEPVTTAELRARALPGHLTGWERFDFHVLAIGRGGWHRHDVDFRAITLGPDVVAHGAPGQVQRFHISPRSRGVLLFVRPDFLPAANPLERDRCARYRMPRDGRWAMRWVDDLRRVHAESAPRPELLRHLLLAWLLRLEPAAPAPRATPGAEALYGAFLALVDRDFARHRDVAHYARRLGYSERTMVRICHALGGAPPKVLVDRRVLLEAQRLLAYTPLSVSALAARLGFSEVTNFVKFFRRGVGDTPAGFRARAAAPSPTNLAAVDRADRLP